MKHICKWIIVVPIVVGIVYAVSITVKSQTFKFDENNRREKLFGNLSAKPAEITSFYTYGTSLNIEGKIKGISKDNLEGIKLIVTDGENFEKFHKLSYSFEDNYLNFSTGNMINNAINLDELNVGNYYVQVRIKVNNNKDYKYYTLANISDCNNIEYYTLTKNEKNNKIDIVCLNEKYNEKNYKCLEIKVSESKLPADVYDIVIDAGHGGKDKGEVSGSESESNLMLEYGKEVKEVLESKGYKVKMTRDDFNTDSFTATNMYDENGRISIACSSKAKYMISLHTTDDKYSGIEVYIPNNCDLSFAEKLSGKLKEASGLEFSTNKLYQIKDGIYQKNYNKDSIAAYNSSLKKQGIEPYEITNNTPRLYTIREVGGIATNAYVDGRNPNYSKNEYYNSNQGIECYQVSVGNIKKDKETLLNEKEKIVEAIANCF